MPPIVVRMQANEAVKFMVSIVFDVVDGCPQMKFIFNNEENRKTLFQDLLNTYRMRRFSCREDIPFILSIDKENLLSFDIKGNLSAAIDKMLEWEIINFNIAEVLLNEDLANDKALQVIKESQGINAQGIRRFEVGKPMLESVNLPSKNKCGFPTEQDQKTQATDSFRSRA